MRSNCSSLSSVLQQSCVPSTELAFTSFATATKSFLMSWNPSFMTSPLCCRLPATAAVEDNTVLRASDASQDSCAFVAIDLVCSARFLATSASPTDSFTCEVALLAMIRIEREPSFQKDICRSRCSTNRYIKRQVLETSYVNDTKLYPSK